MKTLRLQKTIRMASFTLGAAALIATTAVPASADPPADPEDRRNTAIAKANPGMSDEVLNSLPSGLLHRNIKVDRSYTPQTPVIYPDGTPVEGQSPVRTRDAQACGEGTVFGPGPGTDWGPISEGTCGVAGSEGFRATYTWDRVPEGYTTGCVDVRGFDDAGAQTWYGAGCGTSGANPDVPWGNVLGLAATRAKTTAPPAGFAANWSQGT